LEFSAFFGHSEAKFVAGDARWKEPEARLDLVRLRGPSRRTNADDTVVGVVGAADNCHNTSHRSRRRYSDHPATRGKGPHREKLKARVRSFRRYVIAAAQKRPPSTRCRDTVDDDGVTIVARDNPLLIIALRRIPLGRPTVSREFSRQATPVRSAAANDGGVVAGDGDAGGLFRVFFSLILAAQLCRISKT